MFGEYIAKNLKLYEMRHGYTLNHTSAAYFIRNQLASAIRSRNPYIVNCMLAGVDENGNPGLYWFDYLGTMTKVAWGAQGYANMFTTGLIEDQYKADISREEAYELLVKALNTLHKRFLINIPKFKVRVVDKSGISELAEARPNVKA